MRVTKRNDGEYIGRVFHYKGTLEENIIACEKEIAKINEQLPLYIAIYDKAKKELDSKKRRLEECRTFISEAKTHWIPERDAREKENNI